MAPILVLSLVLLLVAVPPSWAHDGPHPAVIVADPLLGSDGGPGGLLLIVIAAAGAIAVRRRRLLTLGLVVLLLVLTFEAARHSVHHLDDSARAAECAVAVATAHVTVDLVDGVAPDPGDVGVWYPIRTALPDPIAQQAPAPPTGRAPPASLA
jgi:hypothetical protein